MFLNNIKNNIKNLCSCSITSFFSYFLMENHKNYFILNYPFNYKWYKLYIPKYNKPLNIDYIYNDNNEDLTNSLLPFFNNIHSLTPEKLGQNKIDIHLFNGDIISFENNDNLFKSFF